MRVFAYSIAILSPIGHQLTPLLITVIYLYFCPSSEYKDMILISSVVAP
jgi:hypothetical protein